MNSQHPKSVNLLKQRIFQFTLLFILTFNFSHSQTTTNWTNINFDKNITSGNNFNGGSGRINTVVVDPDNKDIIYVGTPGGGLWRSTTGGTSWESLTDNIPSMGVSAIAIDYNSPKNNRTIYITTGDSEGNITSAVGVFKSIDNGATWNPTGLVWDVIENKKGYELVIDPTNSNVLLAGDQGGIYRTEDAGKTWKRVRGAQTIFDIKYKPGNPSIVYASGRDEFFKSTNGGVKWNKVNVRGGSGRTALAVSPNNPNMVYLLFGFHNPSSSKFSGLYRSSDSGDSFELRFNDRLIREGSERFKNVALTVAPDNAEEVFVGSGRSLWKSKDGGKTWERKARLIDNDDQAGTSQYVFGGVNKLEYFGDNAYAITDVGIFKTENGAERWRNISKGLSIAIVSDIGLDPTNANRFTVSSVDNGTNIYDSGTYNNWAGGTGISGRDAIIDPNNPQIIYATSANGGIIRTDDGGRSSKSINAGDSNGTFFRSVIPSFTLDPKNSNVVYALYTNDIYKSENRGDSWVNLTNGQIFNNNQTIVIAPSDNKYIYVSKINDVLYYSHDGGASWTRKEVFPEDTTSEDPDTRPITNLTVNPENPKQLWLTVGGNFTEGEKVYKSEDGGVSFTNISGTLPNIPVHCIVYKKGSDDGVYIGTDNGVFYRDNTLSDWQKLSGNLPNTPVTDLEIQERSNKIYATTLGRGVWVSDLDPSNTDTTPEVGMTSPAEGDTFTAGSNITLTSTASVANGNIVRVTWFQNGKRIRSDSGAPYSKPWENVPAGTYAITATAEDDKGVITTSEPVNIKVTNDTNSGPRVVMTSPSEGDVFEGGFGSSITLSSTASDADTNIVRVTWFQNGKRIRSDSGAPYSKPWENVSPGTYAITAVAENDKGQKTTSEPVNITVTNRQFAICNETVESYFSSIPFDNVAERGEFEAEFKVFARSNSIDGVIGLGNEPANAYTDFAILVRLNQKGYFDVRNGDTYMKTAVVRYEANVSQVVRIKGNMDTKTYSVFVRPTPNSKEVQIADNYKFRTEQANITKLNSWNYVSGVGTLKFCITREIFSSSKQSVITDVETKLYPNPANDKVALLFSNSNTNLDVDVNIFDLTGKEVKKLKHTGSQRELIVNTSSLESGMYIVITTIDGNTQKSILTIAR